MSTDPADTADFWIRLPRVKNLGIAVGVALIVALVVHQVPSWGIPLHSDTTWIFRLMAGSGLDANVVRAIPEHLRAMGAFPANPLTTYGQWYATTGRINVLDFASFWSIAWIAGGDPETWRLFSILPLSVAVGGTWVIMRRLGVSPAIAILFVIPLIFDPVEVWQRYNTSEARGAMLVVLALLLATGRSRAAAWGSALFMVAATLTKEPMASAWVAIPAMTWYGHRHLERPALRRTLVQSALPHLIGVLLVTAVAAWLFIQYPVTTNYAVAGGMPSVGDLVGFALRYGRFVLPAMLLPFVALVAATALLVQRDRRSDHRKFWSNEGLVVAGLGGAMLLHGLFYLASGRLAVDRYIIPGNIFAALALALVSQHLWDRCGHHQRAIPFAAAGLSLLLFGIWAPATLVTTLACVAAFASVRSTGIGVGRPSFSMLLLAAVIAGTGWAQALRFSALQRIEQTQWDRLVREVTEGVPANSEILLRMEDPLMIETAQSLQANALLDGRTDLQFAMAVEDTTLYQRGDNLSHLLRNQIRQFNESVADGFRADVVINADRQGAQTFGPEVQGVMDGLIPRATGTAGQPPQLNYTILNPAPSASLLQ